MHRRLVAAVAWLAVVATLLPLPAAAQDPCEDAENLTINCQFDTFSAAPGGYVASGWWPFVIFGHPAFDQSSESPKQPAQRIWSDGEGFVAGIYQTVSGVTPGATYQAYIGWFVFQSTGPEMGRSIGIDPTGGTDPTSAAIVWSPEVWEKKRLAPELVARAVAQADTITVFVRVNHPKTYGADQAFLDAVSLVLDPSVPPLVVAPAETPTAWPTDTPVATATQVAATATQVVATAPAAPTPTPSEAREAAADGAPVAAGTSTLTPGTTSTLAMTLARPAASTGTPSPTATAIATSTPGPTATPLPAVTTWDVRGGTGVAELAFAPGSVAASSPDAAEAPSADAPWAVPLGLGLVGLCGVGVAVRRCAGSRKGG